MTTDDVPLDLDLDLDFDAIPGDDLDFLSLDQQPERGTSELPPDGNAPAAADRPYHPKRPHKKSRAGCKQCKTRKVKCDEARPSCRSCTLRRETCVYPSTSNAPSSTTTVARAKSRTSSSTAKSSRGASPVSNGNNDAEVTTVVSEPAFRPTGMADETDMKMLWFYTLETYNSFTTPGAHSPAVDHCLRVKVVEHAFASPFLMQCLMGLSALQLKGLGQPVDPSKAAGYRARAFEGYRSAIEAANPKDFPALLASSLLMCALSTQMFRDGSSTSPLYIVDWMQMWRGIGLIIEIISPKSIEESGLAIIFYRPPMDLEKSFRYIPNNLLFMVTSIKPGDDDYEHQQVYYEVLRFLGSFYMEMENGLSPVLDLRVITFFTFMPRPFIALAKEHRPRTLIILAHYLCFTKLNQWTWWMQGIADPQLKEICDYIGDSWSHLLRVPRKVMTLTDRVEIARTLLDNNEFYDKYGSEATVVNGQFKIKGGGSPNKETATPSSSYPTWDSIEPPEVVVIAEESSAEGTPDPEGTPRTRKLVGPENFGIGHPLNTTSRPNSHPLSPAESASTGSPSGSARG
ncbi:hypothetical protein PG995_015040 [Apiospora arundinis]